METNKVTDKRQINIKLVGFRRGNAINGVKLTDTWLYKTLNKHYDIVMSDKPDYVICNVFNLYEYCKYKDSVRIMYTGENYVPDFNLIDYAISSYPLDFFDRNFYLPQSLWGYDGERKKIENGRGHFTIDFVKSKTRFANFIASYDSENQCRGDFFKKLTAIKKVDSAGIWLNNTGIYVNFLDNSKTDFQRTCKFSLCFESTCNAGFNTEKIMDAFYADTVPIYYGDPYISSVFNPKAFINVADFANFDEAIAYILEIDSDDEKYLHMLNQPIFNQENYISNAYQGAEEFLVHIFEQPLEKAYRRSRAFWPLGHDEFLAKAMPLWRLVYQNKVIRGLRNVRRKIKKRICNSRNRK